MSKRDMEQQLKQWTFLPDSICMYWIFGTHSEIYLPIMKNLSTFSPIFSLPVLKLLRHILPICKLVHPFSNFSGTFSPFIQNIYGGTLLPR
jgi:hypothetical protein